ncbi:MAG: DsrE family protein [Gammaproteobacteria bacterium]
MWVRIWASVVLAWGAAIAAQAGSDDFHAGELIPEFGKIADVDTTMAIPGNTVFQIAFDVGAQAELGSENRNLASAARFLNMHVAAGAKPEDLHLAVVVHGGASKDLLNEAAYKKRFDVETANAALLRALMKNGVRVILCGQTAAYYDVTQADLEPGVEMSLSAMTAHALLQQQGYTLNPF